MTKTINQDDIDKGQAAYTPLSLKFYNFLVLDVSNRWIWRCHKNIQIEKFQKNITANHLDIGVGTGYFLTQCQWPEDTQLSLMDLNQHCLETTKQALPHINIHLYQQDIYKAQPSLVDSFDSISMNYLLHCLPGDMDNKRQVLENAVHMLKPDGVLFGATIISDPERQTWLSRTLMNVYNKKKIFSNQNDDSNALHTILKHLLDDVQFELVGCVALFKGRKRA